VEEAEKALTQARDKESKVNTTRVARSKRELETQINVMEDTVSKEKELAEEKEKLNQLQEEQNKLRRESADLIIQTTKSTEKEAEAVERLATKEAEAVEEDRHSLGERQKIYKDLIKARRELGQGLDEAIDSNLEAQNDAVSQEIADAKRLEDFRLRSAKENATNLAKETAELDVLFEALKNTNVGSEERAQLIEDINNKYGTTLKNMKDEAAFAEQIETAYAGVVEQLEKKIKLQIVEDELVEVMKRQREQVKKVEEAEKALTQARDKESKVNTTRVAIPRS
jgi:hypothetical protein